METLQQRRDELERKEQQLKESLLKFDKFFKACQEKIKTTCTLLNFLLL
jgi:prefoldin subunit 5